MSKEKEYYVYFEGFMVVEAENIEEAKEQVYDSLNEVGASFNITLAEEDGNVE
ncbi:MAG: hypothetical protein WC346_11655 [Methanogenium sp.]|jgi:hypothetical protein